MATNISYPVIHDPGVCTLVKEFGLDKITTAAYTMVKASLDAFVNNDADLAKHVLPTDSTVDGLERQFKSDIIALMREKPEIIPQGVELISILSNIERMADHATNIAENVIFLFEAKMVRHRHLEEDPLAGDDQG
jgi:phosphate transport system protein